jgi:hypothetical protein
MSKRHNSFDPDYRRSGWNTSRYAPKNGGPSITVVATRISLLIIALAAFPIYKMWQSWAYQEVVDSLGQITYQSLLNEWVNYGLVAAIIALVILPRIVAFVLRRAEWKRIKSEQERLEVEAVQAAEARDIARHSRLSALPLLHTLSPSDFEHEVARIIQAKTGLRAVVCGGKGDGGVDVRVYRGEQVIGIVQCKRYDPVKTLPPSFVRELVTVRDEEGVAIAYLVTTGRFSTETREFANRRNIRLMDGNELEASRRNLAHRQPVLAPRQVVDLPNSRPPSNVWRPPR